MRKQKILFITLLITLCLLSIGTARAAVLFYTGGGTSTSTVPGSGQVVSNNGSSFCYVPTSTNGFVLIQSSTAPCGVAWVVNTASGGGGSTTTINGAPQNFNFTTTFSGSVFSIASSSSGGSSTINFTIPKLLSAFTNDVPFLSTSTGLTIANLATSSISQFVNDSGYVTSSTATININGFSSSTFKLQSTTNQVTVTQSPSGTFTFATPQNINTAATVQFLSLGLNVGGNLGPRLAVGSVAVTAENVQIDTQGTITPTGVSGGNGYSIKVEPTFSMSGSNHTSTTLFAGVYLESSTISSNPTSSKETAQIYINGIINGTTTNGNYAIHIASGTSRFDGNVQILPTSTFLATNASGTIIATGTPSGGSISINGFSNTAFNLLGSGNVTSTTSNGSTTFSLTNSGVVSGTYNWANLTVSSSGVVTAASQNATPVISLSNNSSAGGIDFSASTGASITGVLHSLNLSQFTNDSGYITTSSNNFGGITGSGTSTYITVWNGATSTTGFSNFTFSSTAALFSAPTGTFSGTLNVVGTQVIGSTTRGTLAPLEIVTTGEVGLRLDNAASNPVVLGDNSSGQLVINNPSGATGISAKTGNGTDFTIQTKSDVSTGVAGNLFITGSNAGGTNKAGANVTIQAGSQTGAGAVGKVNIISGGASFGASIDTSLLGAARNFQTPDKAGTFALVGDNVSEFVNDAGYVTSSAAGGVTSFLISATTSDYSAPNSTGTVTLFYLPSSTYNKVANNLSDLSNTSTARTNLGFSAGTNIAISSTGTISNLLSVVGDGLTTTSTISGNVTTITALSLGDGSYYFTNTASDLSSNNIASDTPLSSLASTTIASLSNGTTSIQKWATVANIPGVSFIPVGVVDIHIAAAQTAGTKPTQIYGILREVSATGTVLGIVGTSPSSTTLTGSLVEYDLDFTLATPYTMGTTASRLQADVVANVSGALLAPTVQVYYGGTSGDSRLEVPASTIDTSSFVPNSRNINAGGILSGGGNLSADRTISLSTSTLYSLFSATSPLAFSTSTGSFSCPTCGTGNGTVVTSSAVTTKYFSTWGSATGLNGTSSIYQPSANDVTVGSTSDNGLFSIVNASNTLVFNVQTSTSPSLILDLQNAAGTSQFSVSTSGVATEAGNLLFSTDNTADIGASGANRPRNLHLGGTIDAGSMVLGDLLASNGTIFNHLAVGANSSATSSDVLMASSTATNGVAWTNIPAGWEFLGSTFLTSGAVSTTLLTIPAREELMFDILITGYGGGDILSLRFNNDAANSYWDRHYTVAANSTTTSNIQNVGSTLIRLASANATLGRQVTVFCSNHKGMNKLCTMETLTDSNSTSTTGIIDQGMGQYNTSTQITSVTLITAGGQTMNASTGIMIYGKNF